MKNQIVPTEEPLETQLDENDEEKEEAAPRELDWREIYHPSILVKLLNKKYVFFGTIAGFNYIVQFICSIAACNFYSDASRFGPCKLESSGELL